MQKSKKLRKNYNCRINTENKRTRLSIRTVELIPVSRRPKRRRTKRRTLTAKVKVTAAAAATAKKR